MSTWTTEVIGSTLDEIEEQADTEFAWANLSGRYEDVDDYERMCRSCHRRYDNSRRGGDA